MEIKEVEQMWKWQAIREIIIGRNPESGTYDIEFYSEDERCIGTLERARGGKREFKTIDAAARALKDVGINQFRVVM